MSEGAKLTLALLQAGIVDANDFIADQDPASFAERSMKRLWAPEGLDRFGFTYSFASINEGFYFLITLNNGCYCDFTQPALVCGGAHEQLGPSLLTHLYAYTPLTPAFTPEACREFVVSYHWEGCEDAENLMEMARSDLAYANGVEEDSLNKEEVESFADSHYITPKRVDRLIERRYQHPGKLPLDACTALCRRYRFANLTRVCELLEELKVLSQRLPKGSEGFHAYTDGEIPFGAVIGLQGENVELDLVDEIHREHEQNAWQVGEFAPVYALELNTPDTLQKLRSALETSKRMLELTQTLYNTLGGTTCLFP